MEFYEYLIDDLRRMIEFQFPTGWNSTKTKNIKKMIWIGFNSQRDGILPSQNGSRKSFVFVSIPNGMEFYARTVLKLLAKACVSIPNGMEFYDDIPSEFSRSFEEFQFPTGWNSTGFAILLFMILTMFQFPTGWNSTAERLARRAPASCFNSQRDGILHYDPKALKAHKDVSIPNGMEFYFAKTL